MGKGFGGFGGNLNNLMKQAQKMQQDMLKAQEELKNKTVEASSGGGAVKVVFTGGKELKEIIIDPEVVNKEDIEMLQDLIMASVNEGLRKADELTAGEMSKLTGGMNLPGMF